MSEVDWGSVFEWSTLLKCFVVGGFICVIGQILIDKTKLTPARILVIFVTLGAILGGLGIYQYLVDFAGAGAAAAGRNCCCHFLWLFSRSDFKTQNEKAIIYHIYKKA